MSLNIEDSLGNPLNMGDVVKLGQNLAIIGPQGFFQEYRDQQPRIRFTMINGRNAGQSATVTQAEIKRKNLVAKILNFRADQIWRPYRKVIQGYRRIMKSYKYAIRPSLQQAP